jgi:hypothetical protein
VSSDKAVSVAFECSHVHLQRVYGTVVAESLKDNLAGAEKTILQLKNAQSYIICIGSGCYIAFTGDCCSWS